MSEVLPQILAWSEKCPLWQRDALRRLVEKGVIEDTDIKELVEICKGAREAAPLAVGHLPVTAMGSESVTLASIGHPQNINALTPGTTLTFVGKGLTVIYGDNASGKSGYSRILKHLCRARSRETIHPDVYGAKPDKQKALVAFNVDGAEQTHEWEVGTVPPLILGRVSVFDSQCAEHYVERKNEVEFVPYGLDLFNRLAEVNDRVKATLENEIAATDQAQDLFDDLLGTTLTQTFMQNLRPSTPQSEVESMGRLSADDEKRLPQLAHQIAQARANDPGRRRTELSTRVDRIKRMQEHLAMLEKKLSAVSLREIHEAIDTYETCAQAAALASQQTFGEDSLPGTGGNAWRAMWEAARTFSTTAAYQEHAFPNTGDGAKCVLCQQALERDGVLRAKQFEEFVQEAAQKNFDLARGELAAKRLAVASLETDIAGWEAAITDVQQEDEQVALAAKKCFQDANTTKRGVLAACDAVKWDQGVICCGAPPASLHGVIGKLEGQARELAQVENPQELAKLETELADLTARKAIGASVPRIMRELKRRAERERLVGYCEQADTHKITRMHSTLGKKHINDKLCARFLEELKELGVEYLKIELDCKGEKGGSRHRILLKTGHDGDYAPSEVLSEGEHRSVAIALFMSELATADHSSGIVFDDPTSSLDHKWQEKIARRLVHEAQSRQVIVFTHDIIFLLNLQECIDESECPSQFQYVSKDKDGTGIRFDGLPFDVAPIEAKISYLRSELHKLRKVNQEGDEESYRMHVRHFYSLLRASWERAVEEKLLNKAVQRFSREVMTQRLSKIAGDISDADVKTVDAAMTRCSKITNAHDTAGGVRPVMPTPDEIDQDIEALASWIEGISKRRK